LCLLILYRNVHPEYPVLLGANRDEDPARPSADWRKVASEKGGSAVWAPRDLKEGGTWIGFNDRRISAAILNRRGDEDLKDRRSRGLLCLDCLSIDEIAGMVKEKASLHRPFNLAVSDLDRTVVFSWDQELREREIGTGLHALASGEVNDLTDRRVKRALELLPCPGGPEGVEPEKLREVLGDHLFERCCRDNICIHTPRFATVSSTTLGFSKKGLKETRISQCEGNPCQNPYSDLSYLLKD
jgi:hypothetical protein